jgi:biopolymer transport protein ExbD
MRLLLLLLLMASAFQSQSKLANTVELSIADTTHDKVDPKHLLTLILDNDSVYYYKGLLQSKEQIRKAGYPQLRKLIAGFKKTIGDSIAVMIKPASGAGYKDIVNTLDEMTINHIETYAVLDLNDKEQSMLNLTSFMPEPSNVIVTPPSVTTTEKKPGYDLMFFFDSSGQFSYSMKGQHEKAVLINPSTKQNIVKIIDSVSARLNKKPAELIVNITGDPKASYEQFKVFIDAFKEKEILKFSMISQVDQDKK